MSSEQFPSPHPSLLPTNNKEIMAPLASLIASDVTDTQQEKQKDTISVCHEQRREGVRASKILLYYVRKD